MRDPFGVLEMVPTLEISKVKGAYYRALAKHPPHSDPEGFRVVREAYDLLMQPNALAQVYLQSPFDVAGALAGYEEYARAVELAQEQLRGAAGEAAAVARFWDVMSSRTLKETLAAAV